MATRDRDIWRESDMRFAWRPAGYGECVERESTKHGPREDDDLARGVEGLLRGASGDPRTREDRQQEDLSEDDPRLDVGRPDVSEPGNLGEEEIEERANLNRLLTGLHYPAERTAIAERARENGADDSLVERLRRLPEGRFDVFEAIWEALGGQPD